MENVDAINGKKNSRRTTKKIKKDCKTSVKKTFNFEDITNVHIILEFNDKNYPFIPKKDEDQNELFEMRLALIKALCDTHMVFPKSINEILEENINNTEK